MCITRLAFILLMVGGTTSCQVLNMSLSPTDSSPMGFPHSTLGDAPGVSRIIIYEQITASDAQELQLAAVGDCNQYELPVGLVPPRLPELEPWETSDPDAINRKLVSHIEQMDAYIKERNRVLQESYQHYLDKCDLLDAVKTESVGK